MYFHVPCLACHEDLANSLLLEQLDDFRAWCGGRHSDGGRDLHTADAMIPPPAARRQCGHHILSENEWHSNVSFHFT